MRRLVCVLILALVASAAIFAESIKKAKWEGDSHVFLMQEDYDGNTELSLLITNITISGVHYEKARISFIRDIDAVKCYNNIYLLSDRIYLISENYDSDYRLISAWYVTTIEY